MMIDTDQPVVPLEQQQQGPSLWDRVASDSYTFLLLAGLLVLFGSLAVLIGVYFAHYGLDFAAPFLGQ